VTCAQYTHGIPEAIEAILMRVVVFRMAETGLTELPVVGRRDVRVIGAIALADLLKARGRVLDAEHRRERVLGKRLRLPQRKSGIVTAQGARDRDRSGKTEGRGTD
jgi:hypothetical protein